MSKEGGLGPVVALRDGVSARQSVIGSLESQVRRLAALHSIQLARFSRVALSGGPQIRDGGEAGLLPSQSLLHAIGSSSAAPKNCSESTAARCGCFMTLLQQRQRSRWHNRSIDAAGKALGRR